MPANTVARIGLTPKITAEDLHAALDRILDLNGCSGCGFLGFDLHLLGPDPLEEKFSHGRFEDIAGIRNVSVG